MIRDDRDLFAALEAKSVGSTARLTVLRAGAPEAPESGGGRTDWAQRQESETVVKYKFNARKKEKEYRTQQLLQLSTELRIKNTNKSKSKQIK